MIFQSKPALVDHVRDVFTASHIELETMLYRASFAFAQSHAGPMTLAFLRVMKLHAEALELDPTNVVIDSRSHMLMRGMYPCIPGWHHDDVPRPDGGQPDYSHQRKYVAKHLMLVIEAVDAPTWAMPEFLVNEIDVPWPLPAEAVVYNVWDAQINAHRPNTRAVKSGEFHAFDANVFHRGMPALRTGWRWFIRASWSTDVRPENKIRRNANVYLPCSTVGW